MSEMRQVWISTARHVQPEREVAGFADYSGVPFASKHPWGQWATCSAQSDLATNATFQMADTCVLILAEFATDGESLGPSNDDDEAVRVEIRAAELATMTEHERLAEQNGFEWAGRRSRMGDGDGGMPSTFGGQVGWLAHAITEDE